ncbi:TPA: hypothetical protein QCO65_004833 [Bacillus cereus]|uniref:hypothetical protein n=1 Tax=Bacillus sp. FSL H8-0545 TaxID=2921402 RepID=UPI0030F6D994|nr:hypothetical protein [Bacillus cereus]
MDWSWAEAGVKWMGSLGVFTLGTVTVTGIAGYLFKTVFTHTLSKQSEEHKALLNQQTEHYKLLLNQQTEQYKAELQRMNNKHNITFSKLHIDRAETIRHLYIKLVKLHDSSMELLGYDGILTRSIGKSMNPSEMQQAVVKTYQDASELKDYFYDNQIYFSEDICELLEKILGKMYPILLALSGYKHEWVQGADYWKEKLEEIPEDILSEIPKLKCALEKEFRKLLGVIEE